MADKEYLYPPTDFNNVCYYDALHNFVPKLQHVIKQIFPVHEI